MKPRRNSANNCHSPRFTDKKSEARRSETTFAVAGGRQGAEKGLEPGQRGSRLSTCPPHEAARCVRKHVEAAKEAGHAGLCGKSLPGGRNGRCEGPEAGARLDVWPHCRGRRRGWRGRALGQGQVTPAARVGFERRVACSGCQGPGWSGTTSQRWRWLSLSSSGSNGKERQWDSGKFGVETMEVPAARVVGHGRKGRLCAGSEPRPLHTPGQPCSLLRCRSVGLFSDECQLPLRTKSHHVGVIITVLLRRCQIKGLSKESVAAMRMLT